MAGDGKECQETAEDRQNEADMKNNSRRKLERWLNKSMRIKMTDGRTLVGIFLCTDCDCNIIMGSCEEYLKPVDSIPKEDPRILGLAMVPGKHVVSIEVDESHCEDDSKSSTRNNSNNMEESKSLSCNDDIDTDQSRSNSCDKESLPAVSLKLEGETVEDAGQRPEHTTDSERAS